MNKPRIDRYRMKSGTLVWRCYLWGCIGLGFSPRNAYDNWRAQLLASEVPSKGKLDADLYRRYRQAWEAWEKA